MKNNAIAHEQMLISALNTIGKAGVTSMNELHPIIALETMFHAALTPWLEDELQEGACAALLQEAGATSEAARETILAALLNQRHAYGSRAASSCRMDLMLRQARHGARAALELMRHTVQHICLDMARTARRAG